MRGSISLLSLLAIAFFLSCGSSPQNNSRMLQSINVSPASAESTGTPVQFTATGNFTAAPYHVTPQPAMWGACYQNASTNDVTVTSTGVAQCVGGSSATYTVFAADATNCTIVTACGGGCQISGSAQLTCP